MLIVLVVFGTTLSGCQGATDPPSSGEIAIITGGDGGQVIAVSLPSGQVLARLGSLPRIQDASAVNPDADILYLSALNSIDDRTLFRIDLRSLRVLGSDLFSELERRSGMNSLRLWGNYAMTLTPDGGHLLVSDADTGGEIGIAVLQSGTGIPIGFRGPFFTVPRGLSTLPPSPAFPNGAILLLGTREQYTSGNPGNGVLFVIDGQSLQVRDSVTLGQPSSSPRGDLGQMLVHPDGQHVYVRDSRAMYKYDLIERNIEFSAVAPVSGPLALASDGKLLYLMDAGDGRTEPGTGHVFEFDAVDLQSQGSIDLRAAAFEGVNPVLGKAAASADGKYLYVTSGTASRGPLFGPQPRRLIVVELTTRQVTEVLPLGDWGFTEIFLH